MSFLARTALRNVRTVRTVHTVRPACFTTAARLQKGPVDAAKDGLKKVDRTVSDAAVSGIDAGAKAASKVKEATGVGAAEAKGEAHEAAGKVKGAAHETAGKVKGAAEEAKSKL